MDGIVAYLTTASPQLGSLGWIFFLAQLMGLAAGAYLVFVHTERNMARGAFMRQLGIALMVLGGVGVLLGALRMANVPVINQRLWFWVQAFIELGVAGYIFYYMRRVLPDLEKAAAGRRQRSVGTRQISTDPTPATPRPVATTTRREARRDKKRKGK
jgi:hypothetical protein